MLHAQGALASSRGCGACSCSIALKQVRRGLQPSPALCFARRHGMGATCCASDCLRGSQASGMRAAACAAWWVHTAHCPGCTTVLYCLYTICKNPRALFLCLAQLGWHSTCGVHAGANEWPLLRTPTALLFPGRLLGMGVSHTWSFNTKQYPASTCYSANHFTSRARLPGGTTGVRRGQQLAGGSCCIGTCGHSAGVLECRITRIMESHGNRSAGVSAGLCGAGGCSGPLSARAHT